MIGIALYGLANIYQLASHDPIIKHTKKCKFCKQRINEKVSVLFWMISSVLTWGTDMVDRRFDASTARAGLMGEKIEATRHTHI